MEEKVAKPIVNTAASSAQATPVEPSKPSESKSNTQKITKEEVTTPLTDVPNQTKGTSPDVDALIPSDPYYMDPLFYEVANYFGLNQEDYAAAKYKLSEIVDYVIKERKDNSPDIVLKAIRELEDRVQPPSWDEKRYTNIHRYIRLASKKFTIEQAMSAFEKGDKSNG